jgi:hypothetical protein
MADAMAQVAFVDVCLIRKEEGERMKAYRRMMRATPRAAREDRD